MTPPQVKDMTGRPSIEANGAVAGNNSPSPYVPLAGGQMTGTLDMKPTSGNAWEIHLGAVLEAFATAGGDIHAQHFYGDGVNLTGVVLTSQIGAANGVASLDAGGLVPSAQLPATHLADTFVVASQAAMLATGAAKGDFAVRTDVNETFILKATPATTLGNWILLPSPGGVTSWNTRTGPVVPQAGDYNFADLGVTPTTIADYGFTADFQAQGDARWVAFTLGSAQVANLTTPNINIPGIYVSLVYNPTANATGSGNFIDAILGQALIDGSHSFGQSADILSGVWGIAGTAVGRTASQTRVAAIRALATKQDTSSSVVSQLVGVFSEVDNGTNSGAGGSVTNLDGVYSFLHLYSGSTVGTASAIRIPPPAFDAGATINVSLIRLYIEAGISGGGSFGFANNFAIFQAGFVESNVFNGPTTFNGIVTLNAGLTGGLIAFQATPSTGTNPPKILGLLSYSNVSPEIATFSGFNSPGDLVFRTGVQTLGGGAPRQFPRIEWNDSLNNLSYIDPGIDDLWNDISSKPSFRIVFQNTTMVLAGPSGVAGSYTGGTNYTSTGGANPDAPSLVVLAPLHSTVSDIMQWRLNGFQSTDPLGTDYSAPLGGIRRNGNIYLPSAAPASSSGAGRAGEIAWDAGFVYVCTATNTWKRAALVTF